MPTYDYLCDECEFSFEIFQSMREESLSKCPACEQEKLKRVLYPVHVFARGEAKTVAQQADRNMASFGTYELQDKQHAHNEAAKKGRKERPKAERPFWRPHTDKVNTELAKLAPEVTIENGKITKSEPLSNQAINYIMNGKNE